jgi:hypothetical protein
MTRGRVLMGRVRRVTLKRRKQGRSSSRMLAMEQPRQSPAAMMVNGRRRAMLSGVMVMMGMIETAYPLLLALQALHGQGGQHLCLLLSALPLQQMQLPFQTLRVLLLSLAMHLPSQS